MVTYLNPALTAENGPVLRAIGIARISTLNQDPLSLEDQQALLKKWVDDHYDGEVEWKFIQGQGSGESVERKQVVEAEELVSTGDYDLVIMEDLSRHMRRVHAVLFCELCEDADTRLIAINDGIDTAQDWRLHAFFAAIKHEQANKDTSLRIKRSLRNRFQNGHVVQCPIYGYIKPPGIKNDADLQKDPAATAVLTEWFQRLDEGQSFSEIADWLNNEAVPVGPYCRGSNWTCAMVGRVTRNPILKGVRVRNNRISKRNNKTGKYRSIKGEAGDLLERYCPHLAFFDADYFDRVIAKVNARNAKYRRSDNPNLDPCLNRPRKRTRFPGQVIRCGICGRLYVFGGHGQRDHLECSGSREYKCWNAITVDGPLAARRISEVVFTAIEALPDFDPVFLEQVNEESVRTNAVRADDLRKIDVDLARIDREIGNLIAFIREGNHSDPVRTELNRLESEQKRLKYEKSVKRKVRPSAVVVPAADEIKQVARESFRGLALESYEFADLLRSVTGRIVVHPYQCCDGGNIVLRATFRLQIANLLPDKRLQEVLQRPLERVVTIDLFDPPQRVAFREEVIARRREQSEKVVARELGITVTAAQRAAALDRQMQALGLTDPYVRLSQPPVRAEKLKRHLHSRYCFEPLPGHVVQ